jgi:hypothetical protein
MIDLNSEVETGTTKKRRGPPRLSGYILDPRDDRSVFFEIDAEVYQLLEERVTSRREQNLGRPIGSSTSSEVGTM